MEDNIDKVSVKSIGIKYGIILGLFNIGYSLLLQLTGLAGEQSLGYLSFAFMIIILVFAYREFKGYNDGFMKLGQGISLGMLIVVISSVFSSIFTYLYLKLVDDSMIQMIADVTREEMMKNPNLSDEQIEQALAMTANFTTPEMILVFGIIGGLFFGFLISLVMSLIFRKENPEVY
ncbi:MAG: DUF4199 domain-containing protein [Bacteroidota bacterium]